MSHIVQIQTIIKDPQALATACQRLQLPPPESGRFPLFQAEVTGWAVRLPGWTYPVVCELSSGSLRYDNYGGSWGDPRELDRLLQTYAVEKAKLEAHKKGYGVLEQHLSDGSIKLTLQVGGAA